MGASSRNAFMEWFAGLIVGLIPLACHGLLHFTARTDVDHVETWATDILFVSIANSGLLFVSALFRLIAEDKKLNAFCVPLGVFNLVLALCAGVCYGEVAIGQAKGLTVGVAVIILIISIIVSLLFEVSFAMENG